MGDGVAGPSNPPSTANEFTSQSIGVDILDSNSVDSTATVGFAGLAPFFAGVYQINFTVPMSVASGEAYLNVLTNEAYTSEAKLFIQ